MAADATFEHGLPLIEDATYYALDESLEEVGPLCSEISDAAYRLPAQQATNAALGVQCNYQAQKAVQFDCTFSFCGEKWNKWEEECSSRAAELLPFAKKALGTGGDRIGSTTVNEEQALVVHVWKSTAAARFFATGFSRVWRAVMEFRLFGVCPLFSCLFSLQGTIVSVTSLMPFCQPTLSISSSFVATNMTEHSAVCLRKVLHIPQDMTVELHQGQDGVLYCCSLQPVLHHKLTDLPNPPPIRYEALVGYDVAKYDGSLEKYTRAVALPLAILDLVRQVKQREGTERGAGAIIRDQIFLTTLHHYGVNMSLLHVVLQGIGELPNGEIRSSLESVCLTEMVGRLLKRFLKADVAKQRAESKDEKQLLGVANRIARGMGGFDRGFWENILLPSLRAKWPIDESVVIERRKIHIPSLLRTFASFSGAEFGTKEGKYASFQEVGEIRHVAVQPMTAPISDKMDLSKFDGKLDEVYFPREAFSAVQRGKNEEMEEIARRAQELSHKQIQILTFGALLMSSKLAQRMSLLGTFEKLIEEELVDGMDLHQAVSRLTMCVNIHCVLGTEPSCDIVAGKLVAFHKALPIALGMWPLLQRMLSFLLEGVKFMPPSTERFEDLIEIALIAEKYNQAAVSDFQLAVVEAHMLTTSQRSNGALMFGRSALQSYTKYVSPSHYSSCRLLIQVTALALRVHFSAPAAASSFESTFEGFVKKTREILSSDLIESLKKPAPLGIIFAAWRMLLMEVELTTSMEAFFSSVGIVFKSALVAQRIGRAYRSRLSHRDSYKAMKVRQALLARLNNPIARLQAALKKEALREGQDVASVADPIPGREVYVEYFEKQSQSYANEAEKALSDFIAASVALTNEVGAARFEQNERIQAQEGKLKRETMKHLKQQACTIVAKGIVSCHALPSGSLLDPVPGGTTSTSFIDREELAFVHVWKCRREGRKFQMALRALSQMKQDLCLPTPLHVPFAALVAYQCCAVSVVWLVPLLRSEPLLLSEGSVLGHIQKVLAAGLAAADRIPFYAAADGRVYALGVAPVLPHTFGNSSVADRMNVRRFEGIFDDFLQLADGQFLDVGEALDATLLQRIALVASNTEEFSEIDHHEISELLHTHGIGMQHVLQVLQQAELSASSADVLKNMRSGVIQQLVGRSVRAMLETVAGTVVPELGLDPQEVAKFKLSAVETFLKVYIKFSSVFSDTILPLLRFKYRTSIDFSVDRKDVDIAITVEVACKKMGVKWNFEDGKIWIEGGVAEILSVSSPFSLSTQVRRRLKAAQRDTLSLDCKHACLLSVRARTMKDDERDMYNHLRKTLLVAQVAANLMEMALASNDAQASGSKEALQQACQNEFNTVVAHSLHDEDTLWALIRCHYLASTEIIDRKTLALNLLRFASVLDQRVGMPVPNKVIALLVKETKVNFVPEYLEFVASKMFRQLVTILDVADFRALAALEADALLVDVFMACRNDPSCNKDTYEELTRLASSALEIHARAHQLPEQPTTELTTVFCAAVAQCACMTISRTRELSSAMDAIAETDLAKADPVTLCGTTTISALFVLVDALGRSKSPWVSVFQLLRSLLASYYGPRTPAAPRVNRKKMEKHSYTQLLDMTSRQSWHIRQAALLLQRVGRGFMSRAKGGTRKPRRRRNLQTTFVTPVKPAQRAKSVPPSTSPPQKASTKTKGGPNLSSTPQPIGRKRSITDTPPRSITPLPVQPARRPKELPKLWTEEEIRQRIEAAEEEGRRRAQLMILAEMDAKARKKKPKWVPKLHPVSKE